MELNVYLTRDDIELVISCIDRGIEISNQEIKDIDLGYMNNEVPYKIYYEARSVTEMNLVHLQELKLKFERYHHV
jgi:hypothetical protein